MVSTTGRFAAAVQSSMAHAGAVEPERIRLAELVAGLSLDVDLGFGQPMEHVLRQCIIALELADRAASTRTNGRSSTTPRSS